jgi:peptidoglycan/xylan/chitin deacetylase (PgdA/CDA1 family)
LLLSFLIPALGAEPLDLRFLNAISNKRKFIAQALRVVGFIQLLEKIAATRRQVLVILTYHRIAFPGVSRNPYYDSVISATPDELRSQLMCVQQYCRIVDLNHVIGLRDAKPHLAGKPLALVTFDDGYRDNFHTALPILRNLSIPATFFIPTIFLQHPRLPWWDHIAYVIKRTQADRLSLQRFPNDNTPVIIELGADPPAPSRVRAIGSIIRLFSQNEVPDECWFLGQLEQQAGVSLNSEALAHGLFMTVTQLKQLADAGMTIGSHSHHHSPLSQLADGAQQYELHASKQFLENTLGREVSTIAYPFGWSGTFSQRTMELAASIGYRLGFSSVEGVNDLQEPSFRPMSLLRLSVGGGDSSLLLRARVALYASFKNSFL